MTSWANCQFLCCLPPLYGSSCGVIRYIVFCSFPGCGKPTENLHLWRKLTSQSIAGRISAFNVSGLERRKLGKLLSEMTAPVVTNEPTITKGWQLLIHCGSVFPGLGRSEEQILGHFGHQLFCPASLLRIPRRWFYVITVRTEGPISHEVMINPAIKKN